MGLIYWFEKTVLPRRMRSETLRRGEGDGEGEERNKFLIEKPSPLPG